VRQLDGTEEAARGAAGPRHLVRGRVREAPEAGGGAGLFSGG
jgi:hypothetical protein